MTRLPTSDCQLPIRRDEESAVIADTPNTSFRRCDSEAFSAIKINLVGTAVVFFEKILALAMLCFSLPLIIVIAVLICLDSPGGAIFMQRRIGRFPPQLRKRGKFPKGRCRNMNESAPTFVLYKFRTFRKDADRLAPKRARFDFAHEKINDIHLQLKDDPRATRVGRFLRRTSLDELPNLINVVKGDMRLIGPRPEAAEMLRYYHDDNIEKFHVKPGVTGLAQVNGRGKLSFDETIKYDLEYVRRRSFWLNCRILLKTIKVVLTRDGAY